MDPAKQIGGVVDADYFQPVYDALLYQDPSTGALSAGLALSATPSSEAKVWTIKLRPNVKFSDGTPFDATAVMDEFKRCATPATACFGISAAAEIASMKVVDAQTLQVTLNAVDSTWSQVLAIGGQGGLAEIPSPTAVAKYGANYGTSPSTTVGAGPFTLSSWIAGQSATMTRNPKYWNSPQPYLQTLNLSISQDPATAANALTSGQDQLALFATSAPQLQALQQNKTFQFWGNSAAISDFAMNTKTGPTANPLLREVLVYGVNMNAVDASTGFGAAPATSLAPKGSPYSPLGVSSPSYDPAKAKSLMQQYLQQTHQTSVTVEMTLAPNEQAAAEAMQQFWSQIPGLNVKLTVLSNVQTSTMIATRSYTGLLNDAVTLTPRSVAAELLSTSPQNLYYLNDPKVDAAIHQALSSTDPAAQKAAMVAVAQQWNQDVPGVLQWVSPFDYFAAGNVHGMKVNADFSVQFQSLWLAS
jgi:peptide/nickel transport system substrate-binding protein